MKNRDSLQALSTEKALQTQLAVMEGRLAKLPKGEHVKKVREYRDHSATIKAAWSAVREKCTRAEAFHHEITEVTQRLNGIGVAVEP